MLTIIVPYRDREEHLKQFIPHMNKYVPDAKIIVVEQAGSGPFNRGRLLNIGFLETNIHTHYCFHDVDLIPVNCKYDLLNGVNQLAYSKIQPKDYLGGVTMFDITSFFESCGYHNDYFHRAEDNEMMFNLKQKGIFVADHRFTFKQLPHPRTGPEFIPELWQKAQLPRNINMLENCKYELISKEVHDTHTHLKVRL